MTKSGGPAAIRGFRLQTTYVLLRLLQGQRDQQFKPEGQEDLDIFDVDGKAIEHVQVKAYGQPLQLSHLSEKEPGGAGAEPAYFERALHRLKERGTRERLVSFGTIGPELIAAWKGEGPARDRVREKLQQRGYSHEDTSLLLSHLILEGVTEEQQQGALQSVLREGMTAGDVQFAMDALSWWLFQQSELGTVIPLVDFQERLQRVGQHLVEGAAGQHVWGYALTPLHTDPLRLQDTDTLRQQLYEGTGARLEHIQANVDVRREAQLNQMTQAFETHSLVVLHGASGQGKSALAYRFLHENAHTNFTYELQRIESLDQVRQVIFAIQGRMRVTSTPLWLLVDVYPGEALWLDVVRGLVGLPQLFILVTIREEDWGRAGTAFDALPYTDLPLVFSEVEARTVFDSLVARRPSTEFLAFEEAWRRFELRGPLLEFVYMVTHEGQHLRARLAGQIAGLEHVWDADGAKLDFLHAASLAAAFGARVDTLKLAEACGLHPRVLKNVISALENEHLLRVKDETVIEGLHAVRSQILLDLLSSPETPPLRAFKQVLQSVLEDDLEYLLLNALLHLPRQEVVLLLREFTPSSWTGWAAVVRALIWLGVAEHLEQTKDIVQTCFDTFEYGFWMYVHIDLLGLSSRDLVPLPPDWATATYIPEPLRAAAQSIAELGFPPCADFSVARQWWETERPPPQSPRTSMDWLALAEIAFYVGLWGLSAHRFKELNTLPVIALPLREAAQVHYGLTSLMQAEHLADLQSALLSRLKEEASILALEDDGSTISIHFVMPEGHDPLDSGAELDGSEKSNLAVRMRRLKLLRNILPDRQKYACQGYGHRMALLPLPLDGSHGDMPRENLPPVWGTSWNRTFIRLAERHYLLPDWQAQADHQWKRRVGIVETLEATYRTLTEAGGQRNTRLKLAANLLGAHPRMVGQLTLPRLAVDPWGLALQDDEEGTEALNRLSRQFEPSVHDPYFKALRDYMAAAQNFMFQGALALMLNGLLSETKDRNQVARLKVKFRQEMRYIHLSTVNLTDMRARVTAMQQQYRQRLSTLVNLEELAALEVREQRVIQAIWDVWDQYARPVSGVQPAKSAEEIIQLLRNSLDLALKKLKGEGQQVREIPTARHYEGEAALWLQLDLPQTTALYEQLQTTLLGLHQWIAGVREERFREVLFHQWPRVVIVPTRGGQPWRTGVFAYYTRLLQVEPQADHWWQHLPRELPPGEFQCLGFDLEALQPDTSLQALQVVGTRYLQLVSRQRDIARLVDLEQVEVDVDKFVEIDQEIQECERLVDGLCDGVLGEEYPQLAQQARELVVEGRYLDLVDTGFGQQLPMTPEEEDAAAVNALVLLILTEQEKLQVEERVIEQNISLAL